MTDLSRGIVNLNGSDIGPKTTVSEILEAFPKGHWIHDISDEVILCQMGLLHNEKGTFVGRLHFHDGKLREMYLSPACVKYPDNNDHNIRQVQRDLCDGWLRGFLGEPDVQNEAETNYRRNWGSASACFAPKAYDGFDSGSVIRIVYTH